VVRSKRAGVCFPPVADARREWDTSVVKLDFSSFLKAVAAGTIAGGGPYLLFTVPVAIADAFEPMTGKLNIAGDLYLAALPVLVALPLVLFGSIVIGIPTAMILRRNNWEDLRHYVLIGATTGFLIPVAGLIVAGAEWGPMVGFGAYGAFSGGITGLTWSRATQKRRV
jgi:hypothetical protein